MGLILQAEAGILKRTVTIAWVLGLCFFQSHLHGYCYRGDVSLPDHAQTYVYKIPVCWSFATYGVRDDLGHLALSQIHWLGLTSIPINLATICVDLRRPV